MNTHNLINHPHVIRPIQTTLRSFGVKKQDLEDGVQEVQTRTLEYLRGRAAPATVDDWARLCVAIARSWRLDEKKKAKVAAKYCEGLCEDPDQHIGIEPGAQRREDLDARRMVRVLDAMFEAGEMPDKGDEVLDCLQAGMKVPAIATELELTADCVRMRWRRMRQLFEDRLTVLGMMALLAALVWSPAAAANDFGRTAPVPHVPVPPPRAA